MRLQDRTSNSANGTKANSMSSISLPSMVRERSSMNLGARWINKKARKRWRKRTRKREIEKERERE